ncbi:MAG: uroporphyrinogen III methyltransferase/synthase [Verrucomicrobiales bacterium]|jgi:uroporphyrinogen III methyltransferase/synthase
MTQSNQKGICYLVGSGPGDLGLVTLRAKHCIEIADIVLYDYLCNPEILQWAKPDAEIIYVGKKAADHTIPQDQLNALLVEKSSQGKTVTRLKGGDPYLFGRGGEEGQELHAAGVPFEIVPGITSAISGPAYAGIPVTHRDHCSQLTIFTGHEDPTKDESSLDFKKIANADGTKVMLMGVGRLPIITKQLIDAGAEADTPIALVRWATRGNQETITGTLATIAGVAEKAKFAAPAVAVIGGVVTLRDELNWFETRPLFGKKIVVTRTRKQAGVLSAQLRELGADVYEIPTIRIDPPDDMLGFGRLVQEAHTYDWLLFTSPNGVDAFFDLFFKIYKDARSLGGARIAAVGPGTAKKLAEYRFETDLIPKVNTAAGLLEALTKDHDVDNQTYLWVRPKETNPVLSEGLEKQNAIVDLAIAYQTVPETEDPTGGIARFNKEGADLITFTSASTVEHFLDLGLMLPENLKIASIGPITSAAIRDNELEPDIEAEENNIPGLVKAIQEKL